MKPLSERFRDQPIRVKVLLSTLAASAVAVLAMAFGLFVFELQNFRKTFTRDLRTLTAIMAENCAVAVAFNDAKTAQETISALTAKPEIVAAGVVGKNGVLLARFGTPSVRPIPAPNAPAALQEDGRYWVQVQPIMLEGERIGTFYIDADYQRELDRLGKLYLSVTAVVLAGAMLLSVVLTLPLQLFITAPVRQLAIASEAVARERDYSLRVKNAGNDEIGQLTAAFNQMLARLGEQDAEIHRAHQDLRHKVDALERGIREREKLEDQLRQAQKMEAVGRLAAGVAHDFNNLLTVILGNTTLQLGTGKLPPQSEASLRQVVQAAERASTLTRQLLAYSRRQIIQRQAIDINSHVLQTASMLRRIIGEDIKLETEFAEDLAPVYADPSNLDQIILNLVLNARDAMPSGGQLTLGTGAARILPHQDGIHGVARPGEYIRLTVRDTGCGMDEETRRRIFEPFFTTKEVGRGTGMGLATVHGIVEQHGGWIDVESSLHRGSVFHIHLPAAEGQPMQDSSPSVPQRHHAARATILVAEDEEMLREFVVTVLEGFGYRVLCAEHGVEALRIWEREKAAIDLLLTDMVMPEAISGRQLAQRLLAEKPLLRVIYTSGYSAELIGGDFERETGVLFLPKPYHAEKLAQTVSQALDGINAALAS